MQPCQGVAMRDGPLVSKLTDVCVCVYMMEARPYEALMAQRGIKEVKMVQLLKANN